MAADWKSIVGTVAPAIATALGGPLAGLGVAAVGKALGLGDGASEEDVAAAVGKASPEQLLALKKANLEFQARMKELDVDLARIAMSDRTSARRREAVTGDSWTPRLLAVLVVGLFGFCVWWAFTGNVAAMGAAQIGIIGGVIGYASAKADTVVGYYFGSSSGADANARRMDADRERSRG